jgi:hypothetical protein
MSTRKSKEEEIAIDGKTYYIIREVGVHEAVSSTVSRFLVVRVKGGSVKKYATVPTEGEPFVTKGIPLW